MVIRHEETEFSTLCYLMPRSAAVQVGQRVHRGDVIARCGNSGNTSEPHIHFQVQKPKDFLVLMKLIIIWFPRFTYITDNKY